MDKKTISKYLKQPYDKEVAKWLEVYLMNDSKFYFNFFKPCVDYGKKRLNKGDYDSVLFIQQVFIVIRTFLSNNLRFFKDHYDLPKKIDLSTRYQLSKSIARYIECDFLGL